MAGVSVDVDDHGLHEKLLLLGRKGLIAAERKGVTDAAKLGRTLARGFAPVRTGAGRRGVSYKTSSRGGEVSAKVYNRVYYMRFQARGTGDRHTRAGADRGVLPSTGFMQKAADQVDPIAPLLVEDSINAALAAAGLL